MTIPVPFNDAAAMERRIERLIDEGRKPACVIMEAAMMNLGVVLPEPGYLEAVRELTRKHGIILIFDEVKTGLCIAAGGATERFGVMPDMVTLAKALGGGLALGRDRRHRRGVGGRRERRASTRSARTTGTRSSMAAARASLFEVLTPEAYAHLDALNEHILKGCQAVDREVQPARLRGRRRLEGLRHVLAEEGRRLRDLQGEPGRRAVRALVALQHEQGNLHDARPRGGVDAVRHALRSRTATATWRSSRRWRAT